MGHRTDGTGLRVTADRLDAANDPVDLFGPASAERIADARAAYHHLAALTHPDRVPADGPAPLAAVAHRAFCRLNELWSRWIETATGGPPIVLDTGRRRYRIGERINRGDICDLFTVTDLTATGTGTGTGTPHPDPADPADPATTHGGGVPTTGLVAKIPRSIGDNDLLAAEVDALTRLGRGPERHRAYVPHLVDSLHHRDSDSGELRRITILARLDGFVPLSEVRAALPDGLDLRDAAWMWRRLLVALGSIHRQGVTHGAVVPDHVLIHPDLHGVVLVDFCHAAIAPSDRLAAPAPGYRDWYPADALTDRRADPALDLHLAARLLWWLLADDAPAAVRRFLRGCLLDQDRLRPYDAWRLLGELDALLEGLYGPRRFRPFTLPAPPSGAPAA